MKFHTHDINKKTFIIAEIGNNHEGNFDLAKKMISLAAEAGADAVKFQTIDAESFIASHLKDRKNKLKTFQFSRKQFRELAEFSHKNNVLFFSTPFDIESAIFLNEIQPIFKISSGDNNFFPLIDIITSFNKPIIISTGLSDKNGIDKLYNRILNNKKGKNYNLDLSFLHCVSSYPVPFKEANISVIANLIESYPEASIGYSDHTVGIEASILAVSLGAKIIEKHFTIDKNYSDFRDHQLSSDPEEFKKLVRSIRTIELLKGNGVIKIEECEKKSLNDLRRSVGTKHNLIKGQVLTIDDLVWLRPGTGIEPGNEHLIVGKKLNKTINKGELFSLTDFDD